MLIPAQSYAENRYKECNAIHSSTVLSASYELDWYTNQSNPNLHTPTAYEMGWPKRVENIHYIITKSPAILFSVSCLLYSPIFLLLLFLLYNSLHSYFPL